MNPPKLRRPASQRYSDFSEARIRRLWLMLLIALLLTLVAEVFIPTHGHFGWDGLPFVHALLGFAACALIVGLSNLLGLWLKYPEPEHEEKN